MKKKTQNNLRLGLFTTVAAALFIVAIYYVGERQNLFSSTFPIQGVFQNIGGLQAGNNVRFSGINVGIVDAIEQITDSTVRIDMLIVESARKFIKKDAKAVIGSDGLMGNKIVVIVPGKTGKAQIADYDYIETTQPVSLDEVFIKMKTTSDNAAKISGDLSVIMQNVREGKGTVGKLLMDSALAENLAQAFVNIKQGAGGFKQNMDAAGHNFLLRGYIKNKENEKKTEKDKKPAGK